MIFDNAESLTKESLTREVGAVLQKSNEQLIPLKYTNDVHFLMTAEGMR